MKPPSMSLIRGSIKGSKEMGLFFGSKYEGTNPTTYTSSVWHLSTLDIVAMDTSIAPVFARSEYLHVLYLATCYMYVLQ